MAEASVRPESMARRVAATAAPRRRPWSRKRYLSENRPAWRSSRRPPGIPPNEFIETPLVRRAEAGDAEAITDLLRRARPLVERTVARLCIDLQLRDDLVQACLVVVYTDLPALRTPEAFVSWAQGIVRNVCRREVRRQGHSRVAEARVVHETLVGSGGGEALVDPEEVALRAETRAQLQRALAALPAHYRAVVTMRAVHGYTYEEMGRILGAPSQLVRLWYFRGRHRLQVLCRSDDVLADAASTRTGACGAGDLVEEREEEVAPEAGAHETTRGRDTRTASTMRPWRISAASPRVVALPMVIASAPAYRLTVAPPPVADAST